MDVDPDFPEGLGRTVRSPWRTRWWTHAAILRHVNRRVCGEAVDGPGAGLERRLREAAPEGGFRRGISVGCGYGSRELRLLEQGIVGRFELFETRRERVEQGRVLAAQRGVEGRARFHAADAMERSPGDDFDLVCWNNALNRVPDAEAAIRWSRDRMVRGGCFVMDGFVGPSRFQWSDRQLELASKVREMLPERLLVDPREPSKSLPRTLQRPDAEALRKADPSGAADSGNILPAMRRVFPAARIVLTGGVIFHLALNDVLANFDDREDGPLLQSLLRADEDLARLGETHYAVAIAFKE